MGTTGPQILVYPEATGIQAAGIRVEGPGAVGAGANIYYGALPRVYDATSGEYQAPIQSAGFDEMYFYPVAVTAGSTTYYVYGVWGNKVFGGDGNQWTVQLLYTVAATMTLGTPPTQPKSKATSANSTVEYYSSQALTLTAGYSTVLDNAIGCVTVKQDGGAGIYGVVGMPYLGGADYIIVAGTTAVANGNAYVRFA